MIIGFFQAIFRPLFGSFEREEFKKFVRMGLIFAFIIGSYWTLRVLKDATFANLVGASYQPWAKFASLLCLLPIIMIYTKLLDKFSREQMFYILSLFYGISSIVFACLLLTPYFGQAAADVVAARTGIQFWGTQILGYAWYVFVESYGSLVVALFWAIASDTTSPDSAKKGFSFVVAIGQVGGIVGPWFIGNLPKQLGHVSNSSAVFVCAATTLALVVLFRNFLKATPKSLLVSFHGKNEKSEEKEQEPGFLEGLKLMLKHNYLLGIFGILSFFEIIITIFDFHFKVLAASQYSGTELTSFLSNYGSYVNIASLVCLLLGINNITRYLGVGMALILMPIIFGAAITGFIAYSHLTFLFWLMVGSKAINYALNGPAVKQLYIPTTHDVRFKSQAWIETFGSRAAKSAGSGWNMLLPYVGRAQHVILSSYLGFGIVAAWFFVSLYLGKTYRAAIANNKVVC